MIKILSVIIGIFLLATIPLTYYSFHHKTGHTESKKPMPDPIEDGIKLYTRQPVNTYNIDDYISLSKLSKITDQIPSKTLDELEQKYSNNPYKRIIDRNTFTQDITFTQQHDASINLDYYSITNTPIKVHIYDSIFLKALYCDVTGYTDMDFEILSHLDHRSSDYLAVSYLYSLLLLQENQCYDDKTLTTAIEDSADRLARTENEDISFSDIYAERIVLLYWSGYGNLVQKAWIEKIRENYKSGVGWVEPNKQHIATRTTGLSLLALLYYKAHKLHQEIY